MELTGDDLRLIGALRNGLPLCDQPYDVLGDRIGLTGREVRDRLARYRDSGALSRFGVIVRHDRLGYTASAMVVWNVPDDKADALGERLGACPGIGLSYQRDRHPLLWPYNLYAMIPGRSREEVRALVDRVNETCGLGGFPHDLLFTKRCCKIAAAAYGRRP